MTLTDEFLMWFYSWSGRDCSGFLEKCLKKYKVVHLRKGTYYVTRTPVTLDGRIVGSGMQETIVKLNRPLPPFQDPHPDDISDEAKDIKT